MAPEMLEDPTVQPQAACDMYSWALTAWEILSLRLPYHDAEGVPEVNLMKISTLTAVVNGTVRPDVSALRSDTPPRLQALIQRTWDSVPHKRPLASEVVAELQSIASSVA
jgi:pole hole protein